MKNFLSLCFVACPLFVVASACTTNVGEDDGATTTEAALRPIAASEIVGTIAFGETKEVAYTETPRYRALSFSGSRGDEVDIWVRATHSQDPWVWLVEPSGFTVGSNDDASSETLDAHVRRKLPRTGTYYIAMREK